MSVKPVDMQTMLPRLNEASRMQHHTEIQPVAAQHALSEQESARVAREQQQVKQRPSAEEVGIRRDARNKERSRERQERSRQEGKRKSAAQPAQSRPGVGNRLDMKV